MSKPAFDHGGLCASVGFDYGAVDGDQAAEAPNVTERDGAFSLKQLEFFAEAKTPLGMFARFVAVAGTVAPWLLEGKSIAQVAKESGSTRQNFQQAVTAWNEFSGIRGRLQRPEESRERMKEAHRRRKRTDTPAKAVPAPIVDTKGAADVNGGSQ